ncbi:hypothetical protein A4X06_0g2610 [Tilletia controversa]|uniref:Uncharacterized protein n=1 Tax=Tilletia controversa TaxID=13291 RepID=A0A8X7MW45_9BASI|nr:hypothetical protein CF328_g3272 [Tilletia controversa]KAE8251608.1 hypothetical protein A4X06_0g2610 [Tilletia controversa]
MIYPRLLLLLPRLLLLLATGATSAPLPEAACLSCPTAVQPSATLEVRAGPGELNANKALDLVTEFNIHVHSFDDLIERLKGLGYPNFPKQLTEEETEKARVMIMQAKHHQKGAQEAYSELEWMQIQAEILHEPTP